MTTGSSRDTARRGFALPAAIMALVLLSALVAGALFVSTEELRAGRSDVAGQRALAAAEWALERAIAAWDESRNTAMPVGGMGVVVDSTATGSERVVVTAIRVQRHGFLVTAFATSTGDGRGIPARHTVAASLRLEGVGVLPSAALTAGGAVVVDGGSVDGRDAGAAGRSTELCDDAEAVDRAGVAVPDTMLVCGAACTGGPPAGVFGTPPVLSAPGLTSEFASGRLGAGALAAWVQRASIAVAGGPMTTAPTVSGAQCDRTNALNWGDPSGAGLCAEHYPLIHVRGSLALGPGSVGQGVLLVDGGVRVETGARFVGLVIARDDIVVEGVGAEIVGAAFAADVEGAGGSRIADGGAIRFGSCAVRRAMLGTARLVRLPERWWAELR
jgi:hypothetical protein